MSVGISPYLANGWLNTLRNVPFVVPITCAQIHTNDPGDGTANVSDVTDRQAVNLIVSADGKLSITGTTIFVATSAETWTHLSMWTGFDGDPGAHWLFNAAAKAPRTVAAGDRVNLSSMDFTILGLAA